MAKVVKFDQLGATLRRGFIGQLNKSNQFMNLLGVKIDQQTQTTFRSLGARSNRKAWPALSINTIQTKGGKFRKRPGTDTPKGSLKKLQRRYSANSRTLQASGLFRQSFGILKSTHKNLSYGTLHRLAKQIMRDPQSRFHRPVVFVTAADRDLYNRMFANWYSKGLTF